LPLEVLLHLGRGRRFGAGPHATSPKPAAPAHSARARCRRPAAQCPAQAAAWVTTGATPTWTSARACPRPEGA
jgi:hypothetical protein